MAEVVTWVVPAVLALVAIIVGFVVKSRWIVAKPNEWLLVIHSGEMRCAGIGMSAFQGLGDQCVVFPSTVNKVSFRAEQVTKEMQGIGVQGFVVWSIFRDDQGPFTAYKSLEGLDSPAGPAQPNENIARMAESIIRSELANSTISEVVSQREQLRGKIRETMQGVVRSWGVWLETIEITEVRIMSNQLFEDLQAEFRSQSHQTAQEVRMRTQRALAQQKLVQEAELSRMVEETATQKALIKSQQKLILAQEEAKLLAKQLEAERARLEQAHELAKLQLEQDLELKDRTNAFEFAKERQRMQLEGEMTDANRWKSQLEAVERAVRGLPVRDVKLLNVGQSSGPESLLTGLLGAVSSMKAAASVSAE